MKPNVEENFQYLFPLLSEDDPSCLKEFQKVHRVLYKAVFKIVHKKEFKEMTVFDLVTAKGELKGEVYSCIDKYYSNESTRSSQSSILRGLVKAELERINAQDSIHPEAAKCGLIDPAKLQPHMRQIWEYLPRVWKSKHHIAGDFKETLPLTETAAELFRVLVEVNDFYKPQDIESLLKGCHDAIMAKVRTSIEHRLRVDISRMCAMLRLNFGIKLKEGERALDPEQLPPKLAEEFKNFWQRSEFGIRAFPDLLALARSNNFNQIKPLKPTTRRLYASAFLVGAARMTLREDTSIQDLLQLQPRTITVGGCETMVELFSPFTEELRVPEREKGKPGVKDVGADSCLFSGYLKAACCIARYNGHFLLAKVFKENYRLKPDTASRKLRKLMKKMRWTRKWIDDEIQRLKARFDEIVKKKSFLKNTEDLMLVLYLPQLVVLRFLGFRQQCLRRCIVGKNIIFGRDGSITFHYEAYEIKNEVAIHQRFSREEHGGLEEIMMLMDVLEAYYYRVLKTIRNRSSVLFRENVGDAFFTAIAPSRKRGLVVRHKHEDESHSYEQRAKESTGGASKFRNWFVTATYKLISFAEFKDFGEHFHPHFLRGVCVDWMRKDLRWSWDEIEQAMGDREATLKKAYFDEGKRLQDASDAFARSSQEMLEKKEELQRIASSVPTETHNSVLQTLNLTNEQLREEMTRRKEIEEEKKTLSSYLDFALKKLGISVDELAERL